MGNGDGEAGSGQSGDRAPGRTADQTIDKTRDHSPKPVSGSNSPGRGSPWPKPDLASGAAPESIVRPLEPGFPAGILAGYVRYQLTTRVVRAACGTGAHAEALVKDRFEDDWDADRLVEIETYLRACLGRGGAVVVALEAAPGPGGVEHRDAVVGFAAVEAERFGPGRAYVELTYLHVTRPRRGRGIGGRLFVAACSAAEKLGAERLYIGAHPAVETQAFYRAAGCVPARYTHPTVFEREPRDIQLEKRLVRSDR